MGDEELRNLLSGQAMFERAWASLCDQTAKRSLDEVAELAKALKDGDIIKAVSLVGEKRLCEFAFFGLFEAVRNGQRRRADNADES